MANPEIKVTFALEQLAKRISDGECILFLGAGVHAAPPEGSPFSYPAEQRPSSARELAKKLAKECEFERKFKKESPFDLMRVALCYELTGGLHRQGLADALDRHLRTGRMPSPALKMLAQLPFKIFVTTNYDLLLDKALAEAGKVPKVFTYSPKEDQVTGDYQDPKEREPLVFKMHGDLNTPSSIVITDEDYITFVQRMSDKDTYHPVPQTIRYRMLSWPTLFVGYSLRDFNLRLLFRTLRWHIDPASIPPAFSVDRNPDPLILQVWQDQRRFVTFVTEDLWSFVLWLFNEIYPTPKESV